MANPRFQTIVYGCTEWAIFYAIRCARLGLSVALLMDAAHLGGFTSGGLSGTDVGKPSKRLRGLYREHYDRITRMTGQASGRVPAPSIAEQAYRDMLGDAGVRIYTGCQVTAVASDQPNRIVTLTMVDGRAFDCTLPFDASVCMDVLQRLGTQGAHWTIGREAAGAYNESLAGANRWTIVKGGVFIPGTTTLYPQISPNPGSVPGAADDNVQAYVIREVHSCDPYDRITYDKMKIDGVLVQNMDYDRTRHLLGAPAPTSGWITAGCGPGLFARNGDTMLLDPDGKPTHRRYALMSYADRDAFYALMKLRQMQQCYFNLTDPSLDGTAFRDEISTCGLPRYEFRDNDYFAYAMYARETIRPIGAYVMRQGDTNITDASAAYSVFKADGIAIGGYSMDQHASIWFQSAPASYTLDAQFSTNPDHLTYTQGYAIPMRSLYHPDLPMLFGYPSCTHIAWSTVRIVLNLCLAAEASAQMAYQYIVNGTPLAQIDPAGIRTQLTALGLYVDPIPAATAPDDPDPEDPDDPDPAPDPDATDNPNA